MPDLNDYPVVDLPGSLTWTKAHEAGASLEARFVGQDGDDFAQAVSENAADVPDDVRSCTINGLLMVQQGERDYVHWVWIVKLAAERSLWLVSGGCDYTGWDCQSSTEWAELVVTGPAL